MKHKYLIPLITVFFIFPFSSYADDCGKTPVKINLDLVYNGHQFFHNKSRVNLPDVNKSVNHNDEYLVQGITTVPLTYRTQIENEIWNTNNKNWCVSISGIDVKFGIFEKIAVDIARELKKGTCPYNVVMKHELEHVSFAKKAVYEDGKSIPDFLKIKLQGRTFKGKTRAESLKMASDYTEKAMADIFNQIQNKMQKRNQSIDTVSSYKRLTGMCPTTDWKS